MLRRDTSAAPRPAVWRLERSRAALSGKCCASIHWRVSAIRRGISIRSTRSCACPGKVRAKAPVRASRGFAKRTNLSERSEEHTSELQSLMRISYAVFCLKKKKQLKKHNVISQHRL